MDTSPIDKVKTPQHDGTPRSHHDTLEHPDAFHERTREVVVREGVLLEEVLPYYFRYFHHYLLVFGQRLFADELHDLRQRVFLLEDVSRFISGCGITRIEVVEERF